MRTVLNATGYHVPVAGPFTQATLAPAGCRLLFVSGITARDARGAIVGAGDIRAQTHQVLRQMAAIVENAGGSMRDVLKTTTFVLDADQIPAISEIRRQYFGEPPPASSTVQVSRLYDPQQLIEIEAIVAIPPASS